MKLIYTCAGGGSGACPSRKFYCFWPCSLAVPVLTEWVYGFVVLCPGTPKAQPAVVLVLKRLRRWGNSFKSHPTDWEKPGIEPATPGLQDIGLSPTPRRLVSPGKLLIKMVRSGAF